MEARAMARSASTKKIAPRVQDAALSPLERAKAALAAGNYDAVFAEVRKQRAESRELAILAEAEPLLHQAVTFHQEKFGADDPVVAVALNNLALLLQDTNRLQEAEPLSYRYSLQPVSTRLGLHPLKPLASCCK